MTQKEPQKLSLEGGASLAYHKTVASDADAPNILFMGGFLSDMEGSKALYLEAMAKTLGWNYIRFDYQGHGRSSGRFEDGTIGLWKDDALTVLDQLTKGPQILIGSSMGGWIALLLALERKERVAGLIGLAAAPDFTEYLIWDAITEEERQTILRDGIYHLPSDYCDDPESEPYPITRALIEDGRTHMLLGKPIAITCPVRLLHEIGDKDVPYDISLKLAEHLQSNDVVIKYLKGDDHRMSGPQALALLKQTVLDMVINSV